MPHAGGAIADAEPALPAEVRAALESIYEEILWLAQRPHVTASRARAWYTHVMAESVKRKIRRFTGQVSAAALAAPDAELRLEHYRRIQTMLTQLVERHRRAPCRDAEGFIRALLDAERVHIVTVRENYAAMKAGGDYATAGIALVDWQQIDADRQAALWRRMLRGRVANAAAFAPPGRLPAP